MAYNVLTAGRIREYLVRFPQLRVDEKKMFSGLMFMVNDKMCVCVSGDNLMCRFDPELQEEIAEKRGFLPMIMKGRELKGYCYVDPIAFDSNSDLAYWINLCLDYNGRAKSTKATKVRK